MSADPSEFSPEREAESRARYSTDGALDPAKLARGFLDHFRANFSADVFDLDEKNDWAHEHVAALGHNEPAKAWEVVTAALNLLQTPEDAAFLAAGLLETLIADHGPAMIDRIETLAAENARFKYVLSGVWPREQDDGEIWARVLAARDGAHGMDDGAPLPAMG